MRNKRLFEKIVRKTQPELKGWLYEQLQEHGYKNPVSSKGFLYAPGSVPVMLVAHLDTVHKEPVKEICWDKDYNVAMSPQGIGGDDRCGVYMILRVIKELQCHVLFCEDEEVGGVGARKFTASNITPMVNYIIEFDRKGSNDAVFYDCANKEFTALLESYGFVEDYGSFSDISVIAPALKVAAVNISSGYYSQHTKYESIHMCQMNTNADRISGLIRENHDTFYEYVPDTSYRGSWGKYYKGYKGYGCYDYDYGYGLGYDDYDYGYNDYVSSRTTNADTVNKRYIMPLPAQDSCISYRDGEWKVEAKDAPFFGIDNYGNLFCREYDDSWSFIESDCDVLLYETEEWVNFDRTLAEYGKVEWFPEAQAADEEKPWTEEEEVSTV